MKRFLLLPGVVIFANVWAETTVRVRGSTTVAPVVSDAADVLLERHGIRVQVDTMGGSSGGLRQVGEGLVEVGMSSKALTEADFERYREADLRAVSIGSDAVARVVSRDVWEGGVRALTREQVQGIYEGRIRNWKEVGGPDRRVVFFNKEPGRGTWEVFAKWAYGSTKDTPLVSLPEVSSLSDDAFRPNPEKVRRARERLRRNAGPVLFGSRFMPVARLPVYLAAGLLRIPVRTFYSRVLPAVSICPPPHRPAHRVVRQ